MLLPSFLRRWIDRSWRRSVEATTEALFPPGDDAPDHVQADLSARTQAYVVGLPDSQRPLLKLLFLAVEWLAPILAFPGPFLSRRPPPRRLAAVERWRESWFLPARLLGDALRASLVMVYYSHPDVMRAIGEPPEGAPMRERP